MRETATIDGISRSKVGTELFERLCQCFPKGRRPTSSGESYWWMVVPAGDPRVAEAVELLASAGFTPATGLVGRGVPGRLPSAIEPVLKTFRMNIERKYTRKDYLASEFLELFADRYYQMIHYTEPPSELWVERKVARSQADFVGSARGSHDVLVPQRVRAVLEEGRLQRLQFRSEVHVSKTSKLIDRIEEPWSSFPERWWELRSDLTLPPISPACVLNDYKSEPYDEKTATVGSFLREEFYLWPEIHYRRRDLERTGEFDIAMTYERFGFGSPTDHMRSKIVSQRFYRYCWDRGLRTKWRPVRVDDE